MIQLDHHRNAWEDRQLSGPHRNIIILIVRVRVRVRVRGRYLQGLARLGLLNVDPEGFELRRSPNSSRSSHALQPSSWLSREKKSEKNTKFSIAVCLNVRGRHVRSILARVLRAARTLKAVSLCTRWPIFGHTTLVSTRSRV